MAVSTLEIVAMMLLFILLGVAVWWFAVAGKYRLYLDDYKYARGAHATTAGQTIKMTCDADKKICIDSATQICSVPDHNNFESSPLEPISSGLEGDAPYGAFDPKTTVDMKKIMAAECNGKSKCTYTFKPETFPGGVRCPSTGTQLIATYVCVNKDDKCPT